MKRVEILLVGLVMSSCLSTKVKVNTQCYEKDTLHWVSTNSTCTRINTYFSTTLTNAPNLVIVLHGDLDKPGYHYRMAERLANETPNTIAIGMLRPGYTDSEGHFSDGKKGLKTGDNYTPEVINQIADAIEKLKSIHHPEKTILVGHSGGAAISGNIIALKHNIVDEAVMVSCPCDVPVWRKHMKRKEFYNPAWWFKVNSYSPLSIVGKIDKRTKITVVCGEYDKVTPIELSKTYYSELKGHNINATFVEVLSGEHNVLLHPEVFKTIQNRIMRQ